MTFAKLAELIKINNIPEDVSLESDSGWECGPTGMGGAYYNGKENIMIFTQGYGDTGDNYCEPEWSLIWRGKERGNINGRIDCSKNIFLYPITEDEFIYVMFLKERLINDHEFELYCNGKKAEDALRLVDDGNLMFWYIKSEEARSVSDYIGHIGLVREGSEYKLKMHIFKEYRNMGYEDQVMSTLVTLIDAGKIKTFVNDYTQIKAINSVEVRY